MELEECNSASLESNASPIVQDHDEMNSQFHKLYVWSLLYYFNKTLSFENLFLPQKDFHWANFSICIFS